MIRVGDRLFLLIFIVIFAVGCTDGGKSSISQIRIGAVASLTGPAAEQGNNWLSGATLAVEEAQHEGTNVILIAENDETQPAKAALAFNKLVSVDHVQGVIGGTWDFLAATIYPLAARSKIPFVTPTNPVEMYDGSTKANPWIFSNALSLKALSQTTAEFMKKKGIKRVAVIYPNVPYGVGNADGVKTAIKNNGGELVYELQFMYGPTYLDEIRVAAAKAAQAKPDLIFAVLDAGGVDLFLSELERQKAPVPFLTTQHLDAAFDLGKSRSRYANAYGIYPKIVNSDFVERYAKRFSHPPRVFAAEGYDAAKFLIAGIQAGTKFEDSKSELTVQGVTGALHLPARDRQIAAIEGIVMSTESGAFIPWNGR